MKVNVLKCPQCGASLEIEKGLDLFYCKYCGSQISLDNGNQEITINKNVNINKTTSHTERYVNDADVIRAKSESKDGKRNLVITVIIILVMAVALYSIARNVNSMERESMAEEQQLEELVDEVLADIEKGNFDEAYVKANSIHYTSGWSDEIEEKWDDTREALLEKIEEAENPKSEKKSIFDWFN